MYNTVKIKHLFRYLLCNHIKHLKRKPIIIIIALYYFTHARKNKSFDNMMKFLITDISTQIHVKGLTAPSSTIIANYQQQITIRWLVNWFAARDFFLRRWSKVERMTGCHLISWNLISPHYFLRSPALKLGQGRGQG